MYELIFEKVTDSEDMFRMVVIDVEEETGYRSVNNIYEGNANEVPKFTRDYHESDLAISALHDDVDLGRAKKIESRAKKIVKSLKSS